MELLHTKFDDEDYKMNGDVVKTVVRVFKNRDDEQLVREILLQLNQYLDQGICCYQKDTRETSTELMSMTASLLVLKFLCPHLPGSRHSHSGSTFQTWTNSKLF